MRRNKRRNLPSQVGDRLCELFCLLHTIVSKLAEERRLEVSQLSQGATLRELLGKFQILLATMAKEVAELHLILHETLEDFLARFLPV